MYILLKVILINQPKRKETVSVEANQRKKGFESFNNEHVCCSPSLCKFVYWLHICFIRKGDYQFIKTHIEDHKLITWEMREREEMSVQCNYAW